MPERNGALAGLCSISDCRAVVLGDDGRCFGHTNDAEALERGVAELESGRFVTFTRRMRVDRSAMRRISELANDEPLSADFSSAVFEYDALFGHVKFGRARFVDVRFERRARFSRCEFRDSARFGNATFVGDASFIRARFHGDANFVSAGFEGAAHFREAEFGKNDVHTITNFSRARFEGRAEFTHASMIGEAKFKDVTISDRARLSEVTAAGLLLTLEAVTFPRYVDVKVETERLDCSRTRFLAGGQIRASGTLIDLENAQFSSPVTVTSTSAPAAVVSSLRGSDVGGLLLSGVDVRGCRFHGAHNLDRLRMEAPLFAFVGWRLGFARRRLIAEEVHWRRAHRRSWGWHRVEGVPESEDEPLEPRIIASIYRSLRKGREDSKDEPGAADFYYGEMEMRRHDKTRSAGERLVVLAYWLLSGYGLRASRSLAALALVLLVATASFDLCGFAFPRNPYGPNPGVTSTTTSWDACRPDDLGELGESLGRFDTWVFATSASIAVIPRPEVALTTQGQAIRLVLRILGPLLIGLAFLSLRGRVKR